MFGSIELNFISHDDSYEATFDQFIAIQVSYTAVLLKDVCGFNVSPIVIVRAKQKHAYFLNKVSMTNLPFLQ